MAAITVYTATTPVHFSTSNVPITELEANTLLLDTKLEGYIQSGDSAFSEAGDGSFTAAVVFTTTMNTIPSITVTLADIAGTGANTLFAHIANRTTAGFNLKIEGVSTAGAWTANASWIADGR